MKKTAWGITLSLLVISTIGLAFHVQPIKADREVQLSLETDKRFYVLGENVTITLTNIGNETVPFGGWPPWIIYTYPEWEPVYPAIFAFLAWDLDPGESETWTWNQNNEYNGTFVDPGTYIVQEYNYNHTAFFTIVETVFYVDPSTTQVSVGNSFTINVSVTEVIDLVAFGFCLGYNTTFLDVLDVIIQPPFDRDTHPTIEIVEPDGYVHVMALLHPECPTPSGSLPLVSITFNATAPGSCFLNLYDTVLIGREGVKPIPHSIVDGTVTLIKWMIIGGRGLQSPYVCLW